MDLCDSGDNFLLDYDGGMFGDPTAQGMELDAAALDALRSDSASRHSESPPRDDPTPHDAAEGPAATTPL